MQTKMVLAGVGCLICGILLFVAGDSVGERTAYRKFAVGLSSVQAMLAFNRLEDERNWRSLLAKNCLSQLATELDANQNEEMMELAQFEDRIDAGTIKYIDARAPGLRSQLRTFKNKNSNGWSEAQCR
ncbi:MAG TPA: hypothetical protein VGG10_03170 [Rhizomicrobium sp.]